MKVVSFFSNIVLKILQLLEKRLNNSLPNLVLLPQLLEHQNFGKHFLVDPGRHDYIHLVPVVCRCTLSVITGLGNQRLVQLTFILIHSLRHIILPMHQKHLPRQLQRRLAALPMLLLSKIGEPEHTGAHSHHLLWSCVTQSLGSLDTVRYGFRVICLVGIWHFL